MERDGAGPVPDSKRVNGHKRGRYMVEIFWQPDHPFLQQNEADFG